MYLIEKRKLNKPKRVKTLKRFERKVIITILLFQRIVEHI